MIELLLVADQLLAAGDLDRAERIYRQVVGADPRNAMAVVGLARVAEARGRLDEAHELVDRALALDPEDVAALRLVGELVAPASAPGEPIEPGPTPVPSAMPVQPAPTTHSTLADTSPPRGPSVLERIRAFLRMGRPKR